MGISSYVYKEHPIGSIFSVTNQNESIVMSPTGSHFLFSVGNRFSLYEVQNYPLGQQNNHGETILELKTKLNAISIDDRTDMGDGGDRDDNNDDDDNEGDKGNEDNETDVTMIHNHLHCRKFHDITIQFTDPQPGLSLFSTHIFLATVNIIFRCRRT